MLGLQNVQEVEAGFRHTCARETDGTLWCWGANESGQIGNGGTGNVLLPVQIGAGTLDNEVAQVALGSYHTCARKTNNTCYRSLSAMPPASFSIKQLDGDAISLGKRPLRSVTSFLSVEALQMSSS
ncbi:MAG: hypothetical protein IPM54_21150 [Polyangiaceae bacterium]|nr:hypothetical protein [Polyangiaceae bacterium]